MAAVPVPVSSFVGRADELAALAALTSRERLVTVVGPGGCGKTRLVTELVGDGRVAAHGFVELAAFGEQADLYSAVRAGCGLREEPGRDPAESVRERLGRKDGLLVLDNCEHLREPVADLVADLLRSCPALRVLATSRASLGLPGEQVLPLGGLDATGAGTVLLLDRARSVQPDLPAGPATDGAAAEICRLADGLPLAIELAAAHARALPLPAIRDGMADRLAFLASRRRGGPRRHGSVASSLDWSAGLVGERARRALAALSVVDGRFPLDVALAVTEGDRDAVETLVDHSLVAFDAVDGRYVLLELVREYAAALPGAAEPVHDRLLEWAAAFAREVRDGLEHADADALRGVALADAAVASALDRAIDTGRGLAAAAGVVVDLAFGWSLQGRCGDGLAKAARLAAAIDPVPPALRWAHAFLAVYSGDLDTGYELAAAAAAEAGTDRRTAARARILTGMVAAFVDPAGAEPVLADAVTAARAAGDDWAEVEASQIQAYTHVFRGRLAAAVACADAVVPALERLGHGQLRAWDEAIRADTAATAGRFAEARERGRRGFDLAVTVGEPVSALGALIPLLRALVATGRHDEAATVLDAGLGFLDEHPGLGTPGFAALARAVAASAGDPAEAAMTAQAALDLSVGLPFTMAEAGLLLATAQVRAGVADDAAATAAAAVAGMAGWGNAGTAAAAALIGAVADRAAGRDATAVHPALVTLHEQGFRPLVVDALALVGALARDAGRDGVGARLHGASERLRAELGAVVSPLGDLLRPSAAFLHEHAVAVAEGGRLSQAGAVGYAARNRGRRGRPRAGWDSLTPAEHAVAALAAQGRTNLDISGELLVSTATVRTHLRSVYAKLGLANRTELAAAARDL